MAMSISHCIELFLESRAQATVEGALVFPALLTLLLLAAGVPVVYTFRYGVRCI